MPHPPPPPSKPPTTSSLNYYHLNSSSLKTTTPTTTGTHGIKQRSAAVISAIKYNNDQPTNTEVNSTTANTNNEFQRGAEKQREEASTSSNGIWVQLRGGEVEGFGARGWYCGVASENWGGTLYSDTGQGKKRKINQFYPIYFCLLL